MYQRTHSHTGRKIVPWNIASTHYDHYYYYLPHVEHICETNVLYNFSNHVI
jgi:hypothetical protein